MLLKHGLLGEYKFSGKNGALDFIRQTGCIQFDPVDICGRNAELTLQSRVSGFTKNTLSDLLYIDRKLFDYPDKNLSVIPLEDWSYFERYRKAARDNMKQYPEMKLLIKRARSFIEANGAVCSGGINIKGDSYWRSAIHWSAGNKLSRSVLEQMYSTGELVIHHKKGTRKYYDLSVRHIPENILNAPEPLHEEFDHQKWRVLRRIGAVGLLWNRPSDAFLNIWGLDNEIRGRIFKALLDEKMIMPLAVEGLHDLFYFKTEDAALIDAAARNTESLPRCELIAPLDCFLWDRKMIKAIFNYEYTWEIYTPPQKRKYGVYVLPLIYGDNFIGRLEAICEAKTETLIIKNIWFEESIKQTRKIQKAVEKRLESFAAFNGCKKINRYSHS